MIVHCIDTPTCLNHEVGCMNCDLCWLTGAVGGCAEVVVILVKKGNYIFSKQFSFSTRTTEDRNSTVYKNTETAFYIASDYYELSAKCSMFGLCFASQAASRQWLSIWLVLVGVYMAWSLALLYKIFYFTVYFDFQRPHTGHRWTR